MEDRIICECMNVSYEDIKNAVKEGAKTLDDIKEATEAGTICGICEDDIQEVLDELLK
ncbi:(2Fe-2S)-binding protein [Intestinibacter sp.]|uniref:(2Fe-2S)-binding protein n=1 Tax=Intestinibacter sp. TaxID=1965304 RepID=UPI0025B8BC34|nr:(2Fe-2S)-binding protein [Intestinibacter sp.]MCI6736691.1 (2Fe-2S)-binding protein [Intestinibacter sp.]MDY2736348.1 (2Fe-2S)-binding protein [Intestinibacter sp.]MDY4575332.1 (2Fe-2S)-binding protein [Intestinibacter sp.]